MTRDASYNSGPNIIPFASMTGGWLGPLVMFWLYVWGPLRPFDYPAGDLSPRLSIVVTLALLCVLAWWVPAGWYRIRSFERTGRLYEVLGVRLFRLAVPDPWRTAGGAATNRHIA